MLEAVRCTPGPSSRAHARTPPVRIFFAAFVNEAYTRFEADIDIMGALVHLRKKKEAGGNNHRRANPGDITLGLALR